jgi:hypothetical protein
LGSGIKGQKLAGGDIAIALLANTLATSVELVTLIFQFRTNLRNTLQPGVTLGVGDASQG